MKKRWLPVAVSLALVLGGCARFGASSSSSSASSLPENAETVYGRVSYVSGNDFTLALGTYGTAGQGGADAGRPADDDPGAGAEESARGQRGQRSGGPGSGQAGGPGGQGDFNGGGKMPADGAPAGDLPADMPDFAGGGAGEAGGGQAAQRFTETGEELEIRIPVGTPIYYGTLKVDFSQIQIDYVISVSTIPDSAGEPVVIAAEILST